MTYNTSGYYQFNWSCYVLAYLLVHPTAVYLSNLFFGLVYGFKVWHKVSSAITTPPTQPKAMKLQMGQT